MNIVLKVLSYILNKTFEGLTFILFTPRAHVLLHRFINVSSRVEQDKHPLFYPECSDITKIYQMNSLYPQNNATIDAFYVFTGNRKISTSQYASIG